MIKTVITIVVLLLSVISFAQNETKNYPVFENLQVDIRGVGCHGGSGLCSIMETNKNNKLDSASAITVIRQSENTIQLVIDNNNLSIEEKENYFRKEHSKSSTKENHFFTQDEDFVFDEKSLLYLGIDSKYNTIKKGNYSCEIINDKIQVKMTLFEK